MTTSLEDHTTTLTTKSTTRPAAVGKGAGIGIGIALIANLAVFAIGSAGAPLRVVMTGDTDPSDLPVGAVIAASIAPILIGAFGLWLISRFAARGFEIWAAVAVVLAAVSITAPASLDIDTGSKVALACMHVIVGTSTVIGQVVARRDRA